MAACSIAAPQAPGLVLRGDRSALPERRDGVGVSRPYRRERVFPHRPTPDGQAPRRLLRCRRPSGSFPQIELEPSRCPITVPRERARRRSEGPGMLYRRAASSVPLGEIGERERSDPTAVRRHSTKLKQAWPARGWSWDSRFVALASTFTVPYEAQARKAAAERRCRPSTRRPRSRTRRLRSAISRRAPAAFGRGSCSSSGGRPAASRRSGCGGRGATGRRSRCASGSSTSIRRASRGVAFATSSASRCRDGRRGSRALAAPRISRPRHERAKPGRDLADRRLPFDGALDLLP